MEKRVAAFLDGLRASGLPANQHIRAVADHFNLPITTARRYVRWNEARQLTQFKIRR